MQEKFLAAISDIVIFGGSAGGGKTRAMLMDPLRYIDNRLFGAVIFRRTSPEITNQGAMWDEATLIYPGMGAIGTRHNLTWRFPSGARIRFSHLENEDDKNSWGGSQLAYIGFDEMTSFTHGQFWYMLSRNRSVSGVKPCIRGTCNPDPDSFVARLVEWYIDQDTGYAIKERGGKKRWLLRENDELIWGDSRQELIDKHGPDSLPLSFTFIPSNVFDNPILLKSNPSYLANLRALPRVERERLLGGNWKIRASAGTVFRREWFEVIEAAPACSKRIRYYDLAGTEPSSSNPDPDWTVGLKVFRDQQGIFYVVDMLRLRGTPATVEKAVLNTASHDGVGVPIGLEQDPGQAGKAETSYYSRLLAGYVFREYTATKDKVTRAGPASAQAEAGNIKVVRAPWNEAFFQELENFPEGRHDDICLVGSTELITPEGNKPIDEIKAGDIVLGGTGWVRVLGHACNGIKQTISRGQLEGTINHPVLADGKWTRLDRIDDSMSVLTPCAKLMDAEGRQSQKECASCTTKGFGVAIPSVKQVHFMTGLALSVRLRDARTKRGTILTASNTTPDSRDMGIHSQFLQPKEGRFRLKKLSSTESNSGATQTQSKLLIEDITNQGASIFRMESGRFTKKSGSILKGQFQRDMSCITKKELMITESRISNSTPKLRTPESILSSEEHLVNLQIKSSFLQGLDRSQVLGTDLLKEESGIANTSGNHSTSKPVYNITTTDGTYYANGILVHNCDTLSGSVNALLEGRVVLVA